MKDELDGIPVLLLLPERCRGQLVLWLTHLGGCVQQTLPMPERFATAGHPAMTFDPASTVPAASAAILGRSPPRSWRPSAGGCGPS